MTKLRIGFIYLAPFAVSAALVAACSDGDTVIIGDVGADSGADTGTDTGTSNEPDEAGTSPDSGTEQDSGYDAGLRTDTFAEDLANAMCDSLSRCCFGAVTPDNGGVDGGGTFDRSACTNFYLRYGFNGSNRGSEFRDAGNITLDQAKADDCLSKAKALTCNMAGAEFQALRTACFGAFVGKVAAGAACNDDIECVPGTYCRTAAEDDAADAAAPSGVCAALVPLDGNCGSTGDSVLAERECSARQSGEPNHCSFYNFDTDELLDPTEWKCVPPSDVGGRCVTNTWCQNSLCDDETFECVTPSNYFAPACDNWVVKQ